MRTNRNDQFTFIDFVQHLELNLQSSPPLQTSSFPDSEVKVRGVSMQLPRFACCKCVCARDRRFRAQA